MNVKELKQLATDHDLEFNPNYSKKKMIEVLTAGSVEIPLDVTHEESLTHLTDEINKLAVKHKAASSQLEIKECERDTRILRVKINEAKDEKALLNFLKWQRARKLIGVADEYLLNEMIMNLIPGKQECKCIRKIPAAAIHAKVSQLYKYETYFDESYANKATKDIGNTFYVLYIPRFISGEEQVSKELDQKMKRGFHPKLGDFAEEKIVINRNVLIESEFEKYFSIESDAALELY